MERILDKEYTYALIGASSNEEKYGYKVLENLLEAGFRVIPINPKGGTILNQKVYSDIDAINEKIDVAIFVIPPKITEKVLPKIIEKGITKIWLQPGSENEQIVNMCKEKKITCQHGACIMLEQLKLIK